MFGIPERPNICMTSAVNMKSNKQKPSSKSKFLKYIVLRLLNPYPISKELFHVFSLNISIFQIGMQSIYKQKKQFIGLER